MHCCLEFLLLLMPEGGAHQFLSQLPYSYVMKFYTLCVRRHHLDALFYEQFIMDLNFALPCCKILAFVCLPKTSEILLCLYLILNVTAFIC